MSVTVAIENDAVKRCRRTGRGLFYNYFLDKQSGGTKNHRRLRGVSLKIKFLVTQSILTNVGGWKPSFPSSPCNPRSLTPLNYQRSQRDWNYEICGLFGGSVRR
jgi:hypothetical protein